MAITTACSWPEQDAVIAWCRRHKIDVPDKVKYELACSVSKHRIMLQEKMLKYEDEREELLRENEALRAASADIADRVRIQCMLDELKKSLARLEEVSCNKI